MFRNGAFVFSTSVSSTASCSSVLPSFCHICDQSSLFWDASCLNDNGIAIQTLADWLNKCLKADGKASACRSPLCLVVPFISTHGQPHACERDEREVRVKVGCWSKRRPFSLPRKHPIILFRHSSHYTQASEQLIAPVRAHVPAHTWRVCVPSASVRCCVSARVFYWPAGNV